MAAVQVVSPVDEAKGLGIKSADEVEFNPVDPNKRKEEFRNYRDSKRQARVVSFYQLQHTNQTYDFVRKMEEKYANLTHFEMGVWEALEYLDQVVDDSDPDTNLTQIQHALQTAEACRKKYPAAEYDWFHLTGLIHDLGKILAVKDDKLGLPGEPQWAVVGDTFPVGLPFSDKIVLSESFASNPDTTDPRFNSGLGVYTKGCGLSKVHMSWGHDEYMYRVVTGNKSTLPLPALYMIRFHSFYPWHREAAYSDILDDQDREMLHWIHEFNECDLYSKSDVPPSVKDLAPYYKGLIQKYFPAVLKW